MIQDTYKVDQLQGIIDLWSRTKGDVRVKIAILDTFIDLSHPSFKDAKIEVLNPLNRRMDCNALEKDHGTHVTSIIFGNHSSEVIGISPNCSGIIIPIYDIVDSQFVCTQVDLSIAIREATNQKCQIICISGGQLNIEYHAHGSLVSAIEYAALNNCLVVSAAGNDGCFKCYHVPASISDVLVVGAMDSEGKPLYSSNWGPIYSKQGVLAPGKNILGANPGGGVKTRTGTSFATPIVAGIAGLFASYQLVEFNRIDMRLIKDAILNTGIISDCTEDNDEL